MREFQEHIEWLRQRLTRPLPGLGAQELMMGRVIAMPPQVPEHARLSAVLCLLYPENGRLYMLLMKRMEDRTAHSGQVSFPGGRFEPEDVTMQGTALREAQEEVGIDPAVVDVLGALTSLYIPVSNFNVFPFVGYLPERPALMPNAQEVSYTIDVPIGHLMHDGHKIIADVTSPAAPGITRKVKAYQLADNTIIWGATAMIISELETLLKEYGNEW